MKTYPPRPAAPDRWLFAGLLALLAWLPLPWGSNREAAMAVAGVAVGGLAFLWCWLWLMGRVRPPPASPRLTLALVLWLGWLGWIAFQLAPLPDGALAALSPPALDLQATLAQWPQAGPPLAAVSIVPAATVDMLHLSLTYFVLYWLVVAMAGTRRRLRLLLLTIVLAALAQALYGALMTLSGIEYGVLAKKTVGLGVATGTFVNRNHFAAYLGLGIAAAVALLLADLHDWRWGGWRRFAQRVIDSMMSERMRVRVFIAIMVIALVLTRSRMGNIACFAALTVCGSIYVLARHRRWFLRSLILFLSLLTIDVWIATHWVDAGAVLERIERTDFEAEQRAVAFAEFQPVLQEYWRAGSGLGTFAAAYSPHRTAAVVRYFDHAHNEYLEFAIETGVVGVTLLGLLVLLHVTHALRVLALRDSRMRSSIAFAALMGSAALGLHCTVDFNLHIPAVAATWLALLAGVMRCSARPRRARSAAPVPAAAQAAA